VVLHFRHHSFDRGSQEQKENRKGKDGKAMNKEHSYYKHKRVEGMSEQRKEALIILFESGKLSDLRTIAKDLGVTYLTLLSRVKYWRFIKTNKI
jgi:hypothetical protein